jgi:hypothetical protein
MSEEKDTAQMEAEMAELKKQGGSADTEESFIDPQINPSEGLGERAAVRRRKDRVMQTLHTLPEKAQTAILESLTDEDMERYGISRVSDPTEVIQITRDNPPSDADPFGHQVASASEASNRAPAAPESDEPLVGVPVDEYAGGTVVLPQGGEEQQQARDEDRHRAQ